MAARSPSPASGWRSRKAGGLQVDPYGRTITVPYVGLVDIKPLRKGERRIRFKIPGWAIPEEGIYVMLLALEVPESGETQRWVTVEARRNPFRVRTLDAVACWITAVSTLLTALFLGLSLL